MKKCLDCGIELTEKNCYPRITPNGKKYFYPRCIPCHKKKYLSRVFKNKFVAISSIAELTRKDCKFCNKNNELYRCSNPIIIDQANNKKMIITCTDGDIETGQCAILK